MAKKVVATLKSKDKGVTVAKIIRAVKSEKTGAYSFKEEMLPIEAAQEALKKY